MRINPDIFKKYDVRGHFPQDINERTVYLVARAFGLFYKDKKKIVVGRDARSSSSGLKESLVRGLKETGKKVIDIDLASTPAFYFSVVHFKCDGGIFVTASHLSEEYNGLKIVGEKAVPLGRKEVLDKIKEMIENGKVDFRKEEGEVVEKEVRAPYIKELKGKVNVLPDVKVVMDAGNGMTGLYLEEIFKDSEIKKIPLFWETDCSFPNHEANPKIKENRRFAVASVKEEKADLGFLWDGDGDRFYALDSKGEVIDPSFISLIIGKHLLKKKKEKRIVVDIRTSGVVDDEIKKVGGEVVKSKTWHPEIKKKMKEVDAVFGSETSGHYVFRDFYYLDDGLLASLYFLEAIEEMEEPLEEYLDRLRKEYCILPETNFEIDGKKEAKVILGAVEDFYKNKDCKIEKIDGLSVSFPKWHFNLRPSQSEPLLRLNMEAKSQELLEEKKEEVSTLIKKAK